MSPNAADPGTRLAGRYLLEQRLGGDVGGTTQWRALDELLNRHVAVRTLPAGSPEAATVMAAARRAAQLADPRFVRILDAGESAFGEGERQHAWVVSEWVDARTLPELLASGPLHPREARRLATVVAEGLAAAHAAGLSHRCLRPEHVLRSETGEIKIVGLEVDAAVAGDLPAAEGSACADAPPPADPADIDAAALDVVGAGAVLYAALTARWPLPTSAAIPAAPVVDGQVCSPRQVRAGVPADLDDIACRALAAGRRRGAPLRTPAQLAGALAVSANGHETAPHSPLATFGGSGIGLDDGDAPPGRLAAPAEPGRAARAVRVTSAIVLAAGLGLAGWQLLVALMGSDGRDPTPRATGRSAPVPSAPATPTDTVLTPVDITDFDPAGNGHEHPDERRYAIDRDPRTTWFTMKYKNRPNLGGEKPGVGLLLDLGRPQRITSLTLELQGRGTDLEVRTGAQRPKDADDLELAGKVEQAGPLHTLTFDRVVEGRYVLIWLTRLPAADTPNEYRGGIAEITVRG